MGRGGGTGEVEAKEGPHGNGDTGTLHPGCRRIQAVNQPVHRASQINRPVRKRLGPESLTCAPLHPAAAAGLSKDPADPPEVGSRERLADVELACQGERIQESTPPQCRPWHQKRTCEHVRLPL